MNVSQTLRIEWLNPWFSSAIGHRTSGVALKAYQKASGSIFSSLGRLWNSVGEVVWEALPVSPSEARSKSWLIKNELSDPWNNEAVARGYILQVLIMSCFHQFDRGTLIRPFDDRKSHTKSWIAFHATIPLCQKWHLKAVHGQALPMSVLFIRCDGMKRDRNTRVNSNERNTSQNFTTHWTVWVQIDIRKRK